MIKNNAKQDLLAIGIGRKKAAIAIVQIYKLPSNEKSRIYINKNFSDVFLQFNPEYMNLFRLGLNLLNLYSTFRIMIKTKGGGICGQANAISLALARALCEINPSYRSVLKTAGLLRRDSRIIERKKYGLKKARKASQYSKR